MNERVVQVALLVCAVVNATGLVFLLGKHGHHRGASEHLAVPAEARSESDTSAATDPHGDTGEALAMEPAEPMPAADVADTEASASGRGPRRRSPRVSPPRDPHRLRRAPSVDDVAASTVRAGVLPSADQLLSLPEETGPPRVPGRTTSAPAAAEVRDPWAADDIRSAWEAR